MSNDTTPTTDAARPTDLATARAMRKQKTPSFTVVPIGHQEVDGGDGYIYIIPKYHMRDKDGNLAGYHTEFGDVVAVISAEPIRMRKSTGLIVTGQQVPSGIQVVKR